MTLSLLPCQIRRSDGSAERVHQTKDWVLTNYCRMNPAEAGTIRPTGANSYNSNSMKRASSMGLYLCGSISVNPREAYSPLAVSIDDSVSKRMLS